MTSLFDVPNVAGGAAFALHGNRLRRDLSDLTDERIKALRVGAECLRLPSIYRFQPTATVPVSVLRQHEMKSIDTQQNSSLVTTDQNIELVFGQPNPQPRQ
jgi:hypothetical protein